MCHLLTFMQEVNIINKINHYFNINYFKFCFNKLDIKINS